MTVLDPSRTALSLLGSAARRVLPGLAIALCAVAPAALHGQSGSARLSMEPALVTHEDKDGSGGLSAGDSLTFKCTAKNIGTVTLTGVTVANPLSGGGTRCPSRKPGESCALEFTYTVKSTDVDRGYVESTTTANSHQTSSVTDTFSIPVPKLSLYVWSENADGDNSGGLSADDELTFKIMAKNTGRQNLTNVEVSDTSTTPGSKSCQLLQPGQPCILKGTYTVKPADVSNGQILHTATADSDQTAQETVEMKGKLRIVSQSFTTDQAGRSAYASWVSTWVTGSGAMLPEYLDRDLKAYFVSTVQPGGSASGTVDYEITVDKDSASTLIAETASGATISALTYPTDSCFAKPVDGSAASTTVLLKSGTASEKFDIVIVGDGFAAADRNTYDAYITKSTTEGMFEQDVMAEEMNAFNIYRVWWPSDQSQIMRYQKPDGTGKRQLAGWKDTLLCTVTDEQAQGWWYGYQVKRADLPFNENLAKLRLDRVKDHIRRSLHLTIDYTVVIINEPYYQGGASDLRTTFWQNYAQGTPGSFVPSDYEAWGTAAHEFGHMIGSLRDEYATRGNVLPTPKTQTGSVNETNATMQAQVNDLPDRWKLFVENPGSTSPHPWGTTNADAISANQLTTVSLWTDYQKNQSVSMWEGANTYPKGVYRPVFNCRMRDFRAGCPTNCAVFGPVCYQKMRRVLESKSKYSFDQPVVGDFDGAGGADLVLHFENSLQLYRSKRKDGQSNESSSGEWGFHHEKGYTGFVPADADAPAGTNPLPLCSGDVLYPGDFDSDGRTDLLVHHPKTGGCVNKDDPAGTGVTRRSVSLLLSKKTTKDGKDRFGFVVARTYEDKIGTADLTDGDRLLVHDIDGDDKADFILFDSQRLAVFKTEWSGSPSRASFALQSSSTSLPGGTGLTAGTQLRLGSFKDGGSRLAVLYAHDPAGTLETSVTSSGQQFTFARRQQITGSWSDWGQVKDIRRIMLADIDGDGTDELYLTDHYRDLPTGKTAIAQTPGGRLAMTKASTEGLAIQEVYRNRVPRKENPDPSSLELYDYNHYYAADVNGDEKDDLVVYNGVRTQPELAVLLRADTTTGTGSDRRTTMGLTLGSRHVSQVGHWYLGPHDAVYPADYTGDDKTDLVIVTDGDGFRRQSTPAASADPPQDVRRLAESYTRFMGLLVSGGSAFSPGAVYPGWINNVWYHKHDWW